MSAPVRDVEDIVRVNPDGTINNESDFTKMQSAAECIAGMRDHMQHNGVLLDGLTRLSSLTSREHTSRQERKDTLKVLSASCLSKVILPAMQHYHFDNRLQAHACLTLGAACRLVPWGNLSQCSEEVCEGVRQFWRHIANTVTKIMEVHASDAAVQAYGSYALGGIALRQPVEETAGYCLEKGSVRVAMAAVEAYGSDVWLVSNVGLFLCHLADHAPITWAKMKQEGAVGRNSLAGVRERLPAGESQAAAIVGLVLDKLDA